MVIHRTSDSLSRCDPSIYSNIYDVRRHADFKAEPIVKAGPKDTIEISRDKLKEEALKRLRHTNKYVVAQNGFMRIGKYLFFAIAFPPYLLMYGLPKWVLVEGIPFLFSVLMKGWNKVQKQAKKPAASVAQRVVEMMQFIQSTAGILVKPVVHLAVNIRQRMQKAYAEVRRFFLGIVKRVKQPFDAPYAKIVGKIKDFKSKLLSMREAGEKWIQKASSQIQEGVQWIKQVPQMVWGWGTMQFERMKEQFIVWKANRELPFKKSRTLAQKGTDFVFKHAKEIVDGLKHDLKLIRHFFHQRVYPVWQSFRKIYREHLRKTRDFFGQKHQKALAFLKKKQEKLKKLSYQSWMHQWLSKLPLNQQSLWRKWLSYPVVQAICKTLLHGYCFLTNGILSASHLLLETGAKSIQAIGLIYEKLKTILLLSFQTMVDISKAGYQLCRKWILYAVYYSLLGTMMTAILLVWGMRSLGYLMSSLIQEWQPHAMLNFKSKSSAS